MLSSSAGRSLELTAEVGMGSSLDSLSEVLRPLCDAENHWSGLLGLPAGSDEMVLRSISLEEDQYRITKG